MLTTGWVMGVEGGFESGNCISTVGVFGGGNRAEFEVRRDFEETWERPQIEECVPRFSWEKVNAQV
jgi:hypothetical protein